MSNDPKVNPRFKSICEFSKKSRIYKQAMNRFIYILMTQNINFSQRKAIFLEIRITSANRKLEKTQKMVKLLSKNNENENILI